MVLICPICGKEFTSKKGNVKYCSDECRTKGTRIARKEWESRTGYKDLQRDRMRAYRAGKAECKAVQDRKQREDVERKHELSSELYFKRLREKAASGDPYSRMMLSNPKSIEYWEAYKDYELSFSGLQSTRTVNGINIYDPHFAEEVVNTLNSLGAIITKM